MVNGEEVQEDVKQRIWNAATKVFTQKGLDGARMQDIADEAQINKAMLHYYYRNKQYLFEMIFADKIQQVFSAFSILLQTELPFEERIHRFVEKEISIVSSFPSLPVFVLQSLRNDPQLLSRNFNAENMASLRLSLQRILDTEAASGRIRKIALEDFLLNCMSLCIYPVIAQPIFSTVLGISDEAYQQRMMQRPAQVAQLIIQSIHQPS